MVTRRARSVEFFGEFMGQAGPQLDEVRPVIPLDEMRRPRASADRNGEFQLAQWGPLDDRFLLRRTTNPIGRRTPFA
jgi:hypothetical protein